MQVYGWAVRKNVNCTCSMQLLPRALDFYITVCYYFNEAENPANCVSKQADFSIEKNSQEKGGFRKKKRRHTLTEWKGM